MKTSFALTALLASGFLFFTACSDTSSSTVPPATPPPASPTLKYVNPGTSGVFAFIANTSLSSGNLLVLDLVASGQSASCCGVGFIVTLNTTDIVDWAKVGAGDQFHVRNGGVFDVDAAPPAMLSRLEGNQLKVTVGEKGVGAPKDLNSAPIARIAVSLKAGAPQGSVSFAVNKFQVVTPARTLQSIDTANVVFGTLSYTS